MADIRNGEAFLNGRWGWTRLGYEQYLPRGCGFTDIDAFIEVDRRFLFIECKHWDGSGPRPKLPRGQSLGLERLQQHLGDSGEVMLLYGVPNCNMPAAAFTLIDQELHDWRDKPLRAGRADLLRLIHSRLGIDPPPREDAS